VPQKAIFIHITATLQPKPQARLEVRTYDVNLLRQLSDGLNARGIECPPVRLRVTAGYVNGSGVRSNRDLWGLGIHRKQSLRRLFEAIEPHLRHPKRRIDMFRTLTTTLDDQVW
jgi:hypothetical protein